MKNIKLLIITILINLSYIQVFGKDIYVYNENSQSPVRIFTDVRKITFTTTEMNMLSTDGIPTSIKLSDVTFFSFEPTSIPPTSVVSTKQNNISVYLDRNNTLNIQSENIISHIEILSIQGNKICEFTPESNNFSYSISSYPINIYIIKILLEGKELVQKIIKRK